MSSDANPGTCGERAVSALRRRDMWRTGIAKGRGGTEEKEGRAGEPCTGNDGAQGHEGQGWDGKETNAVADGMKDKERATTHLHNPTHTPPAVADGDLREAEVDGVVDPARQQSELRAICDTRAPRRGDRRREVTNGSITGSGGGHEARDDEERYSAQSEANVDRNMRAVERSTSAYWIRPSRSPVPATSVEWEGASAIRFLVVELKGAKKAVDQRQNTHTHVNAVGPGLEISLIRRGNSVENTLRYSNSLDAWNPGIGDPAIFHGGAEQPLCVLMNIRRYNRIPGRTIFECLPTACLQENFVEPSSLFRISYIRDLYFTRNSAQSPHVKRLGRGVISGYGAWYRCIECAEFQAATRGLTPQVRI
ncbi:hypothetical protein B0H17DRAFT_1185311 [Mycena rosella]|uniref:Uncharacterized protein n=1 Tax=Mycena rosella TaxID=1033263 RepID=A0AAD7CS83_MYCRO|nr:hypothetical protein B0H17DRAFT_1185311 [Mycena rosella]